MSTIGIMLIILFFMVVSFLVGYGCGENRQLQREIKRNESSLASQKTAKGVEKIA
jgi:hypothetical protein